MRENNLRRFLPLFFLFFLSCDNSANKPSVLVLTGSVMTVPYKVITENLSEESLEGVKKILEESFAEIDAIFNKWNSESEISKLNQLLKEKEVPISGQMESFLSRVSPLVILTEGKFDPTIESIQAVWKTAFEKKKWPDPDEIALFQAGVGWDLIQFGNGKFFKLRDTLSLDLGGIAKGFLVDNLVDRLASFGLSKFYVEWGGEIKVKGSHPLNRPWRVYISNLEDDNPDHAIAFIELKDGNSLATSGDYLQHWSLNGCDFCHVIDPETKIPLIMTQNSLCSVTVKADSCFAADAIATALMLFPSYEEALKWSFYLEGLIPELSIWMTTRSHLRDRENG